MFDVRRRGRILPRREGIQGNLQATSSKYDSLSQHYNDKCEGDGLEAISLKDTLVLNELESGTRHDCYSSEATCTTNVTQQAVSTRRYLINVSTAVNNCGNEAALRDRDTGTLLYSIRGCFQSSALT